MRVLLDTDVVSQLSKARPNPAVVAWISLQTEETLFLSAITVMEIRFGIESTDAGRRRDELEAWLTHRLLQRFGGRILPVDAPVADIAGRMLRLAQQHRIGTDSNDALIAATAVAHGLELATLNRKHFERLPLALVDL